MSGLKKLIHEIHRRSLWQVLGIYAVVSWIAYQVIWTLTESLGLPSWVPPSAVILLVAGLPVVVGTAFVQQGGPIRTSTVRPFSDTTDSAIEVQAAPASVVETGAAGRFLTWRNALMGGVFAFAALGVASAGWLVLGLGAPGAASETEARPSVAVLPLENRSTEESSAFFADGIHDEILTQLTKISALKVISRTSVMEYRGANRNIRDIAGELGVRHIVEGGVQRASDRVRINVQLIDAETDEHLWADTYEEALTAENVFEIQADVARAIARALRAELTPTEMEQLSERPTQDLEAYEFYLRGNEYWNKSPSPDDVERATTMYERAAELDPEFAIAHAALSRIHSQTYWFRWDRTRDRLDRAREALDRAFELDPDLPEGLIALGFYRYWGFLDYGRALEAFEAAEQPRPGNPEIHLGIAAVQRRRGEMEAALSRFQRAADLDPRSPLMALQVGQTFGHLRQYEMAIAEFDRAIDLNPEMSGAYAGKAVILANSGELEMARRVLNEGVRIAGMPSQVEQNPGTRDQLWLDLMERNPSQGLERAAKADAVLADNQFRFETRWQWTGDLLQLLGETDRARAQYDSSRALLESRVTERPEDERLHSALGIAYASLGRADDAVREGKLAVALLPVDREALRGVFLAENLARIYATIGGADAAIDEIEFLLARPGILTVHRLRLEPWWDPLRDHPRFGALLEPGQN